MFPPRRYSSAAYQKEIVEFCGRRWQRSTHSQLEVLSNVKSRASDIYNSQARRCSRLLRTTVVKLAIQPPQMAQVRRVAHARLKLLFVIEKEAEKAELSWFILTFPVPNLLGRLAKQKASTKPTRPKAGVFWRMHLTGFFAEGVLICCSHRTQQPPEQYCTFFIFRCMCRGVTNPAGKRLGRGRLRAQGISPGRRADGDVQN